jgi:hypothetical protein
MANYDAIATRVMRGDFGNGEDRKRRLRAEGYTNSEISAIQQRVNQLFYGAPVTSVATIAPVAPAVDQAAIDRAAAAQAAINEANRKKAEQEERDRQAAEAANQKARQEAIARMPRLVPSLPKEPVKYANPGDIVEDINELPVDLILKLTLEKIGGMELLSLVRHDTVNGQNIVYRPIKNISQLAIEYNSQNLVKMPNSLDSYFKNFAIKLESHLPQTTNELPPLVTYIDPVTKNVIIDLVNLKVDYEVEVQTISSGKVFDDTIYTEDYS